MRYSTSSALPALKTLRTYYPRVVVQSKLDNTGVAWAAVWNARTAADAIICNRVVIGDITKVAFSPAYNYGLVRKQADCQEAVSLIDIIESMVKVGSPYFSEYPEICPSEVSPDVYSMARTKKLSGYFKLFNTSDEMNVKVQSVKSALVANNVVVGGMVCPPSFALAKESWQPHEQQPDQQQHGGHALCIVGYDDSKFGGAFEVVNTWGKEWGVQGFTWIRYKDFASWFPYAFGLFQASSTSCSVLYEPTVTFNQLTGEEMRVQVDADSRYKFWKSYPTNTEFTIHVNSNMPAYVYSFGVDPRNDFFPLFPRNPNTVPVSFSSLKVPDDMAAVTLTDPPGKNNIYFIFSPTQIDLAGLINALKSKKNVTPSDIQATLGSTTVPVKWSSKDLSFSGNLTGPVVMQVLLEQTRK